MAEKRLSLVHPIGNPNSHHAALAFAEHGILHEAITSLAFDPARMQEGLARLLPARLRMQLSSELGRRAWPPLPGAHVRSHPIREVIRLGLAKAGVLGIPGTGQTHLVDWVYGALDAHVAAYHLHHIDALYAYEDGAASTFSVAKEKGIWCLYDMPTLFYRSVRTIHTDEAERFPELASAMTAIHEPAWKLARKEQEIQMADHIFVASTIVQRSLLDAGVDAARISIIPYGAPVDYFRPQRKADRFFRAIFVGGITPRKGVHYLLRAWQELQLTNAELLLVGANQLPPALLHRYSHCFRHIASVPHHSLERYYSSASVLVLPSLIEGFGMVLLEAMACGIPVITTSNTAGPDIVTNGVEGFIVPIRDVDAIKEKLVWCYEHPQELLEMGRAARHRAEELTWGRYRLQLVNRVRELLG